MNHFSEIVESRWSEAIAAQDVMKWASLKTLTRSIIDKNRSEDPTSILIPFCEGVYRAAANQVITLTEDKAA